ncbi:MAG: ATP-binding cassette domain-containing protein, partial [Lachnospiraceae bacterium]|nr:ATP-binding cassette domain-containing protein [Lachnospiraceae bacterium]
MNKEDRMEAAADTAIHTENDYVIELKDVTKDYGDFVLNKVSFNIPRGCICGFVGQNGAGKTTTIRLIMDIIAANSGEMKVFGKDMHTEGKTLKDDIGVVFDEMGFHDFLT